MKNLSLVDNNWIERVNPSITAEERAALQNRTNPDALAVNQGTVTGNATFNTHSRNNGTVTGTATFNDTACNAEGGTAGTFVPDPPPSCS